MRTTLSANALAAMYAQETGEVFLPIVKLSHPSWPDDLRFVPDHQPVTHQLEVYEPFGFRVALPDDEDEGIPVIRWTADNVTSEIAAAFRATTGPISATVSWIMLSEPDIVQAGPFEVELNSADYDAFEIRGVMTVEPILDEPFGHMVMSPKNAPGLF